MRNALRAALLAAVLSPMPLAAQVAGSAANTLDPRPVLSEIGAHIGIQKNATFVEGSYRFSVAEDLADVGVRLGALSPSGEPTTVSTGLDVRVALMSADHPGALLPLDIALVAGVGAAFPDWSGQLITLPVGISIGGSLPFDTGFQRPSNLYVHVQPRLEHASQIRGDCVVFSSMCQRGWVFRSDLGLSGDLTERTRWYLAAGLGDSRFTGNGAVIGVRTAW